MRYEEMQELVDQVAELLPNPPGRGDRDGYAGWTELAIDTGRQLARVLGPDPDLLRSLLADDGWAPVACRQRRRLLLTVALYTVRQLTRVAGADSADRPRRVVVGDILASTTAGPLLPAIRFN
jgi:hypothetical protein